MYMQAYNYICLKNAVDTSMDKIDTQPYRGCYEERRGMREVTHKNKG